MPTSLPERTKPDGQPSLRKLAAMSVVYGTVLVVFVGLIAYDARVATWISEAAQAEFSSSNETVALQPVKLAVQKAVIK